MRIKIFILLMIFDLISGLEVCSQSVIFVKNIYFKSESNNKKVASFLFGQTKRKEIKPYSLCRIGESRLCVTDSDNGIIIIIDNNGEILKKITHIKGQKIVSPVSACIDGRGNLYVSDSALGAVLKFDNKYKFLEIFISNSKSRITGIAFREGIFYCVDTRNHQILCFDIEGELKASFGKRGTDHGEFNFPTHIAIDNQYLFITDALNFRIQVFKHSGEFIRAFGSIGRGGGNFSKPKGLAVDGEKRIFVVDAMFDNVQIFNFKGEFLYYFGSPGKQDGEFWMPADVLVDKDNLIWITDTYNHRIQVFRLQISRGEL